VHEGDRVRAGDRLTEGPVNPHDILRIKGPRAVQEYLLNEVQEVYRLQGVKINDKHIGVIVKQMLQKVRIAAPGDTQFLEGEHIDRQEFRDENERSKKKKMKPATAEPLLLGITKASLTTQSFISAASFQETTRVLTDAAIRGAKDDLLGSRRTSSSVTSSRLVRVSTGTRKWRSRGWRCRWWRKLCRVRTSRCRASSRSRSQRRASASAGTTDLRVGG
jgi:DNA-directed RNA polymerase subunit beta'